MSAAALKALRDKHAAKVTEGQALVEQGKNESDPTKAVDLQNQAAACATEAGEMQTQIKTLLAGSSTEAALKAQRDWDNDPVDGLAQPGNGATKAAGQTTIDIFTGKVLDESGLGILTALQAKATTDTQYLKSYAHLMRAGGRLEDVKDRDARKFLSEGIDQEGGFLVPAEMLSGILRREPAPTQMLDRVRTITVGKDKVVMLKSNYSADDLYSSSVRVYKTAEGAAAPKTDQPMFGTLTIDMHQFTAELSISRTLLEDTDFDIIGFITQEFRTAMINFAADKSIRGTGVGEHFGMLTRAGQSAANNGIDIVKSGHATELTWTGLRKLKNAVPEQYDQNAAYVFNKKSTQDAIEALVDDNGRPLWPEQQRSGLEAGTPGSLQGYSYVREARMPDVAANALYALFGDLMGYIRPVRVGMTIEPLREIEARRGQVVFLARFREGGDVAEPWRLRVGKIAA